MTKQQRTIDKQTPAEPESTPARQTCWRVDGFDKIAGNGFQLRLIGGQAEFLAAGQAAHEPCKACLADEVERAKGAKSVTELARARSAMAAHAADVAKAESVVVDARAAVVSAIRAGADPAELERRLASADDVLRTLTARRAVLDGLVAETETAARSEMRTRLDAMLVDRKHQAFVDQRAALAAAAVALEPLLAAWLRADAEWSAFANAQTGIDRVVSDALRQQVAGNA